MKKWIQVAQLSTLASLCACAGSVDGEIDGRTVPLFSSAAFGSGEGRYSDLLFGWAGADSCAFGNSTLDFLKDVHQADNQSDVDDAQDSYIDTLNEQELDSWIAQVSIFAEDESDTRDELVDLADEDPAVGVGISLCRRRKEARRRDGVLDDGHECYSAVDGDVRLDHRNDNTLSLQSEGNLKFVDRDGDTAGRVEVTFTFQRCSTLDDTVQDFLDATGNG